MSLLTRFRDWLNAPVVAILTAPLPEPEPEPEDEHTIAYMRKRLTATQDELAKCASAAARCEAVERELRIERERVQAMGRLAAAPDVDGDLIAAAKLACEAEAGENPASSPESKRHHVYAKLRRAFPQARGREVGMAIELACR